MRPVDDLRAAGFIDVVATDRTRRLGTLYRVPDWRRGKPIARAMRGAHGEGAYAAQELFYSVIARLFASGSLGGVRLVARVP